MILKKALQSCIDRYLAKQDVLPSLGGLIGRTMTWEISPIALKLHFLFNEKGVEILDNLGIEPDVTMKGSPAAFLGLALEEHKLSFLFNGKLFIAGDIDTAQKAQRFFKQLHFDWEGALAEYSNDTIAHYTGKFLRYGFSRVKHCFTRMECHLKTYLQYEAEILPTRVEINQFLDDVDRLRGDVDRFVAKRNIATQ